MVMDARCCGPEDEEERFRLDVELLGTALPPPLVVSDEIEISLACFTFDKARLEGDPQLAAPDAHMVDAEGGLAPNIVHASECSNPRDAFRCREPIEISRGPFEVESLRSPRRGTPNGRPLNSRACTGTHGWAFVRKVAFGRDFEAHLNFYVECRAAFASLDAVQETLVLGACELLMRVRRAAKGRQTKKTAAFVRACAAFVFITIPTVDAPLLRLRLNVLGAQVALSPTDRVPRRTRSSRTFSSLL